MRSFIRATAAIALVAASLTGCSDSDDSGKKSVARSSAPTSTQPMPSVTGEATLMLGTLQFTPQSVGKAPVYTFAGQEHAIDTTGILVPAAAGTTVKPERIQRAATVIWMSDQYVLGTQNIGPCSGNCPQVKAPATTTSGLLIQAEPVKEVATDTPVTKK